MIHREQLDALPCSCGCEVPGHAPRYLHAGCHMRARVCVAWTAGVAIVACGECGRFVADIATSEPDFPLPTEAVEVFYQGGELHVGTAGRLHVCGQTN